MCQGAEVTRDGARASARPSWERGTSRVPTRVGASACCHSLICTWVCLPPGQEGAWLCQPQPRPPGRAFCGSGVSEALVTGRAGSWHARAWRVISVRRLITAVNCRSQARDPAGAPLSLHSLLSFPHHPERGSDSAAVLPRCQSLVHAPLPCPFLQLIPRFHVLFL